MKRVLARIAAFLWFFGGIWIFIATASGWKIASVVLGSIFGLIVFVVILVALLELGS